MMLSEFFEAHPVIGVVLLLIILPFCKIIWDYVLEHPWAFYLLCFVLLVLFWPLFVLMIIAKILLWVDTLKHGGVVQEQIIEDAIKRSRK